MKDSHPLQLQVSGCTVDASCLQDRPRPAVKAARTQFSHMLAAIVYMHTVSCQLPTVKDTKIDKDKQVDKALSLGF